MNMDPHHLAAQFFEAEAWFDPEADDGQHDALLDDVARAIEKSLELAAPAQPAHPSSETAQEDAELVRRIAAQIDNVLFNGQNNHLSHEDHMNAWRSVRSCIAADRSHTQAEKGGVK